jgi:hypothetical protein
MIVQMERRASDIAITPSRPLVPHVLVAETARDIADSIDSPLWE